MPSEPNSGADPSWSTWTEALAVVLHRPYLAKTARIALVFGAVLFVVNHYDELLALTVAPVFANQLAVIEPCPRCDVQHMDEGVITCLVPFSVANWEILRARRHPEKPSPNQSYCRMCDQLSVSAEEHSPSRLDR